MHQLLDIVKEKLKKSQNIVALYEAAVGRCIKIKKGIFNLLERCLPYTIYMAIRIWDYRITTKDKKKLSGEPYFYKWKPFAREKYCIIRFQKPDHGLFAAGRQYIYAAEYAKSKGMFPLLDIEGIDDFRNGILGRENVWEDVFDQKRIQDVLKENATILVSAFAGRDMCLPETCVDINKSQMDRYIHIAENDWCDYYKNIYKYVEKYWKFNKNFLRETERELAEIFGNGEKVLGVSLREEFSEEYYALIEKDDVKEIYKRHPLGPGVSEIIEMVEDYLIRWDCEKIFVATMYDDSIKKFESRFHGRIIYAKRERYASIADDVSSLNLRKYWSDRSYVDSAKLSAKEKEFGYQYAKETWMLSKCTYLIGAKGGGTIAALMLNNGQYKDVKILEDKRHIARY